MAGGHIVYIVQRDVPAFPFYGGHGSCRYYSAMLADVIRARCRGPTLAAAAECHSGSRVEPELYSSAE